MSIDAVATVHADQAHVDAASQRLAVALSEDKTNPDASPADAERGHAAVAAARVALAQAEAAVNADQAAPVTTNQTVGAPGSAHLIEVVV